MPKMNTREYRTLKDAHDETETLKRRLFNAELNLAKLTKCARCEHEFNWDSLYRCIECEMLACKPCMLTHFKQSKSKHPHIVNGEFQSDKYPTCPAGKVPLSTKDKTAQDLLWEYAQRRRTVDPEFSADLEICLLKHGSEPKRPAA
jgi:hypothetical protein